MKYEMMLKRKQIEPLWDRAPPQYRRRWERKAREKLVTPEDGKWFRGREAYDRWASGEEGKCRFELAIHALALAEAEAALAVEVREKEQKKAAEEAAALEAERKKKNRFGGPRASGGGGGKSSSSKKGADGGHPIPPPMASERVEHRALLRAITKHRICYLGSVAAAAATTPSSEGRQEVAVRPTTTTAATPCRPRSEAGAPERSSTNATNPAPPRQSVAWTSSPRGASPVTGGARRPERAQRLRRGPLPR